MIRWAWRRIERAHMSAAVSWRARRDHAAQMARRHEAAARIAWRRGR